MSKEMWVERAFVTASVTSKRSAELMVCDKLLSLTESFKEVVAGKVKSRCRVCWCVFVDSCGSVWGLRCRRIVAGGFNGAKSFSTMAFTRWHHLCFKYKHSRERVGWQHKVAR